MKTCCKCGSTGSEDMFLRRQNLCRPCKAAYDRTYRATSVRKAKETERHAARWADPRYRDEKLAANRRYWHSDAGREAHRRQTSNRRGRTGPADWTREQVIRESGGRCYTCNRAFGDSGDSSPEIMHLIPIARGGSNLRRNVEAQCRKCNRGTGGQHSRLYLLEWVPDLTETRGA